MKNLTTNCEDVAKPSGLAVRIFFKDVASVAIPDRTCNIKL